jgi:hypothetical protein
MAARLAWWVKYVAVTFVAVPLVAAGIVLIFVESWRMPLVAVPAIAVGVLLQVYQILLWRAYLRDVRALGRMIEPGHAAMFAGRLEEAEKLYAEALAVPKRMHGFVRFALARANRRRGRLEQATAELHAITPMETDASGSLHAQTGLMYAELLALLGKTGDAEKLIAWADPYVERESGERLALRADRARVSAVIALRTGDAKQALDTLERVWGTLPQVTTLDVMCEVWLWRAFAESKLSSPRESAGPERWLGHLRAHAPQHLGALAVEWPELLGFLQAHGLDGSARVT